LANLSGDGCSGRLAFRIEKPRSVVSLWLNCLSPIFLKINALGVPVGLTAKIRNVALRLLQCVYFGVCVMNEVVEGILNAYQTMRPLDPERAADSRQRISRYIEVLASAGQRDEEQLTIYGLAYLTELLEGADPRFTGC
jgi:hypothetical protein